MSTLRPTLATAAALLLAAPAFAQGNDPGPISSDRPSVGASTATVARGFVQLETGVQFLRDEAGEATMDLLSIGGSSFRVGVHDLVELQLNFAGYFDASTEMPDGGLLGGTTTAEASGAGDLGVAAKWRFVEATDGKFSVGVLGGVSLPTGEEGFGSEGVDPAVSLLFSGTMAENLVFDLNAGLDWTTVEVAGEEERLADTTFSAGLSVPAGENGGVFLELFGVLPEEGDEQIGLDGGFTFASRANAQLDVYGGVGLTDAAPDWFVGAGVAWRFPN